MKTTKFVDVARLRRIALGVVLTLAASSAGAFPFFPAENSDNSDATEEYDSPLFGIALNNVFDPTVLFVEFIDVIVEASDSTNPSIPPPTPGGVDTLTITNGEVRLSIINSDTPKAFPDEGGTGRLNLQLTGVQYDAANNVFFINGPASTPMPGGAVGSVLLTGTDFDGIGGNEDLLSTPGFNETVLCNGFGSAPTTDCIIQLGLAATDATERVVNFFPGGPIIVAPPDPPPAIGPPGQLVGAFIHNGVDPTVDIDGSCQGFWGNALDCVGNISRYNVFTPQVPAPMTLALLSLGLLIVGRSRRRRLA